MTKILYNGKQIDAKEVEVINSSEQWSEFTLANGRVVKLKVPLIGVYLVPDEKTPEGDDVYAVRTSQILVKVI